MKLTGELKDKVSAVDSAAEKKAIIADAGMELTDEELNSVAGGAVVDKNYKKRHNEYSQRETGWTPKPGSAGDQK